MNLSSLAYILFLIFPLYFGFKGSTFLFIVALVLFVIVYSILILLHFMLSRKMIFLLLIIHYVCIIYFVYALNPMISFFLFYSAFALPFTFKVRQWSKEHLSYLITMCIILLETYVIYKSLSYVLMLITIYLK